jgi:hypothetical protein
MGCVLSREEVADLVRNWFEGSMEDQAVQGPDEGLMRTALMDILNVSVSP